MRHQLGLDEGSGSRKFFQEVGSHEVSHQWWGHIVGWKSYHDQWLSEGFAQFSAGLFAQKTQGEKKYKTFLETDRQMILSPLPQSSIRANEAGPIWMGWRLETEKTPGAYNYLVYAKGGFVLHMLRMMLYDFVRNDDTPFIALMRDFVQTYYNKNASTEDFKAICDKHFRTDMGWFFRQWVYGTDLPKISVEYSFDKDPQGVLWKIDIKQQKVPEGFISYLPFVMHAHGGVLAGRLLTKQASQRLEIKLKEKPDSVEINPLYAWLCELDVKKH
jgi:aminopeptidase N